MKTSKRAAIAAPVAAFFFSILLTGQEKYCFCIRIC